MPLTFGADIIEGKVYRSKKKQDNDEEKQALKELQTILSKKNRKACDCEAQVHDLIENCLICGRLTCVEEGPGKCISCGSIILYSNQRVKLSKYIDIVHTRSTSSQHSSTSSVNKSRIIDEHFDHFAIDNKKHLKESDKKMLRETLEELQVKRYQKKLVFEVDLDNLEAGTRLIPLVDDYEAELQLLKLNENYGVTESNFTLSELVHLESKKNYNYEYVNPSSNDSSSYKKHQTQQKSNVTNDIDAKSHDKNLATSSSANITNQNKPNRSYQYKTNIKGDKNRRNFYKKKDTAKPSAWNQS